MLACLTWITTSRTALGPHVHNWDSSKKHAAGSRALSTAVFLVIHASNRIRSFVPCAMTPNSARSWVRFALHGKTPNPGMRFPNRVFLSGCSMVGGWRATRNSRRPMAPLPSECRQKSFGTVCGLPASTIHQLNLQLRSLMNVNIREHNRHHL